MYYVYVEVQVEADSEQSALDRTNKALSDAVNNGLVKDWRLERVEE